MKNGAEIAGATSSSYTIPPATAGDDGSLFSVGVSNSGGTTMSNNATLTVRIPPSISTQPVDKTVKAGKTARFSVVASGTKTLKYQWRKNGLDIAGATKAAYTTPSVVAADSGSLFSVFITNSAGSATSNNALLTVK